MQLPPSKILIKRKRDAEPTDILYIQRGGDKDPKRAKLEAQEGDFQFLRVEVDAISGEPVGLKPSTSKLGSHNEKSRRPMPSSRDLPSSPPRKRLEPRRFHLMKSHVHSNSQPRTNTGVQKSKAGARDGLIATFSEQVKARSRAGSSEKTSRKHNEDPVPAIENTRGREQKERPLKKPNATATELEWRAANWKQPRSRSNLREASSEPLAPKTEDERYLRLAADLQQFAIQTTGSKVGSFQSGQDSLCPPTRGTTKFQPRPPPLRYNERHPELAETVKSMDVEMDRDDSSVDWVYDTYIRQPNPNSGVVAGNDTANIGIEQHRIDTSRVKDTANIGFLVIRDEDEDDWGRFEEEAQSESEGEASDEEDENAEDYYANDYPEEDSFSDIYDPTTENIDSDDEEAEEKYSFRRGRWMNGEDGNEYDLTIDSDVDSDIKSDSKGEWKGRSTSHTRAFRTGRAIEIDDM